MLVNPKIIACTILLFIAFVTDGTAVNENAKQIINTWSIDDSERVSFTYGKAPYKVLYVSLTGKDTNSGSMEEPFATLERARDEVRKIRQEEQSKNEPVVIEISGGTYAVSSSLLLEAQDSGLPNAPVTYRAAKEEECIFSGGVSLKDFAPVTNPEVLKVLPPETHDKVLCLSLKSVGIDNLPPLVLGNSIGSALTTEGLMELFWDGESLPMARYPNDGMMRVTDVSVQDGHKLHGLEGSKIGRLIVNEDRLSQWKNEKAGMLYGYWFFDWADSYEQIDAINIEKQEVCLKEPYHRYGYRKNARFYALNMLCEIDAPGEWYLDRETTMLYLYPPSDPASAAIELSYFSGPMVDMNKVSNVHFEGITWELSGGDTIHVNDGQGCLFAGCTVRKCGGNGITINGGKEHAIISCDIYSMGRGGAVLTGGNRKTLEPGNLLLANSHIHHLSRINHTYTPAALLNGVGNRCVHNVMHHIPSSAMRVNGNDHFVAFNEVYDVLLESDDQGGADMWGNATFRGNVYRYNFWHHLGNWDGKGESLRCGQAGIRLDDAISGTLIYGNIFYRCSSGELGFGGVQIHGGKDNLVENNIFADCAAAVSFSHWSEDRWENFIASAMESPEIDRELYLKHYPDLAQLSESANANTIRKNLVWKCGKFLLRNGDRVVQENNVLSSDDTLFPDAENNDFRISNNTELLLPEGFKPIPFNAIGCYADEFRNEMSCEL